jgi:hypothetical protein
MALWHPQALQGWDGVPALVRLVPLLDGPPHPGEGRGNMTMVAVEAAVLAGLMGMGVVDEAAVSGFLWESGGAVSNYQRYLVGMVHPESGVEEIHKLMRHMVVIGVGEHGRAYFTSAPLSVTSIDITHVSWSSLWSSRGRMLETNVQYQNLHYTVKDTRVSICEALFTVLSVSCRYVLFVVKLSSLMYHWRLGPKNF